MSLFGEEPKPKAKPRARKAKPVKDITRSTRRVSDEQLITISALQALAPLLHSDELVTHQEMIETELNPEQRARIWRLRRG